MRWFVNKEDLNRYYDARQDRPRPEKIREYYQGLGEPRPMYEEELKDLNRIYTNTLNGLQGKMQESVPLLVYHMEAFMNIYKQQEALREKISVLSAKVDRETEEMDEGGDYE